MRIVRLIVPILIAAVFVGCAFTDRNHLATTNWVDRKIVPANGVAQWLMTPVIVPVAVATMAVDNLVVAPIVQAPSAYIDAKEWFTEEAGGYYTEMGVLPIRVALTPVVAVGSCSGRTVLALKTKGQAAWGWPDWGILWVRDEDGKLLGPSSRFDRKTKQAFHGEEPGRSGQ